jgi:hypothetical protein
MAITINGKTYRITQKALSKYKSLDDLIEKEYGIKPKLLGDI